MREGEYLGLERKYAVPDNGYIFVKKSLTYIKDRRQDAASITIPKLQLPKNGKERKVLKEFQQILETLGMEKRRFHDLRHTVVSLLVKESQKSGEGISIIAIH